MTKPSNIIARIMRAGDTSERLSKDPHSFAEGRVFEAGRADAFGSALTTIKALEAALSAERSRAERAEAELSDWRNGDARGVVAHMEAFRNRAAAAEAERDRLSSLLEEAGRVLGPFAERADAFEQIDSIYADEDWNRSLVTAFRAARSLYARITASGLRAITGGTET